MIKKSIVFLSLLVLGSYKISFEQYNNGNYCSEVDYYNPKTGTYSTYTLSVKVKKREVIMIKWPNGGWLDSSHFSPPDIANGTASFEDDKGREYEVHILEQGDSN